MPLSNTLAGLMLATAIAAAQPALAASQADREAFVAKLVSIGAIKRIDRPGGDLPHVWATPYLLRQDYDTQDALLNACWAFAYHGRPAQGDILVIRNSQTGQRIGTYSHQGLRLK